MGEGATTAEALASVEPFSELDAAVRHRLARRMVSLELPGGSTLLTEGEPGDAMYVVVAGRLRASVAAENGVERVVGEIAAGEIVGEMSLLSDAPRSATVRAVRDTRLLSLSKRDFDDVVVRHPESLLAIARQLVSRLERANRSRGPGAALRNIALVPAQECWDLAGFAVDLKAALDPTAPAMVVDRATVEAWLGAGAADAASGTPTANRLRERLEALEGEGLVVTMADPNPSLWTHRCVRQADRILVVGDGDGAAAQTPAEVELLHCDPALTAAAIELVLVHPRAAERPTGTAAWLADRRIERHHHVRRSSASDMRRLARLLTGTASALVLSGGGARGFAHFGVMSALEEAGIAIDLVGGTSFGAVAGAPLAMGWSIDEMIERTRAATVDGGSLIDFTFPYTSLARGKRVTDVIRDPLRDALIEDLWLGYFCVSSDLTAGRLRVHDSGPLWEGVRASAAIPGIFPPVRSAEGHVLVDGGIMDNLPVDVMIPRVGGGRIIAVDLKSRSDIPSADLSTTGVASGWEAAGRRVWPFTERMAVPRMIDVMIRTTELASGERRLRADITVRPELERFGLLDFASYRGIVEAGYVATQAELAAHSAG